MLLVRHKVLNVYRAAKLISKSKQNADKIMHEANLLKNLEHPGIPLIYDIEEDSDSICIIEEYIAGKSLSEYMNLDNIMNTGIILQFAVQLCNILEYIHNSGQEGIIHLDLKPDNIIIDEKKQLWLIDFDNAIYESQSKNNYEGTKYFASPEQYHRLKTNKCADIYSLGMVLLYMVNDQNVQSGVEIIHQHLLYPIIRKCLHHNPEHRFKDVVEIRKQLVNMQTKFLKRKKNGNEHSIVIRVKGARHGIGATHLCLSMAACFQKMKIKTICIDHTNNHHIFYEGIQGELNQQGIYKYNGVSILPDYNNNIRCPEVPYQVILIDEGDHSKQNQEKDIWLRYCYNNQYKLIDVIIDDGKYGEKEERKFMKKLTPSSVIFANHMNGMQFYEYTRELGRNHSCYAIPCIYKWNCPGELFERTVQEFIQDYASELAEFLKLKKAGKMRFEFKKIYIKIKKSCKENCWKRR